MIVPKILCILVPICAALAAAAFRIYMEDAPGSSSRARTDGARDIHCDLHAARCGYEQEHSLDDLTRQETEHARCGNNAQSYGN